MLKNQTYPERPNSPDPALFHARQLRIASEALLTALRREHPEIIKHLTNTTKKAA